MVTGMTEKTRGLVEQARSGDQRAFAEAFQGVSASLLREIEGQLGPLARQGVDPEDVLQDTFVRALHSLGRFEWRGEGSFRGWLKTIAGHVSLDVVRHQGRRKTLRLDAEPRGAGTSPSRGMARRERLQRLERALQGLSPDYRMVLGLSRMQGLSIGEIAARMDRSESAVKNLLLRATKQLRMSFGETESLSLGSGQLPAEGDSDGR